MANPARSVLMRPGARFQLVAGVLAQLTQGAGAIGIVLVVRRDSGSVALAGAVAGALAISVGVARPVQGRLIDRRGQVGVMVVCGLVHPTALSGIVGLSLLHAPGVTLLALGVLAGLALPPVSTAMRVAWGDAVDPEDRTAAYSLVYLTQELSLLTGPLIFAAMIAITSPPVGLVTVAALSATGTIAFGLSARSASHDYSYGPRQRAGGVLRPRPMQLLLAVAGLLGGAVGAIEVGVPTLATAHGTPATAGVLIALLSVGGVLGAIVYGARRWTGSPAVVLVSLVGVITATSALMTATESVPAIGLLLLAAGLALNPALTTLSLLVDGVTDLPTAAEAFGWLSTAISLGQGTANALAGALIQHDHKARAAFVVAAIAAGCATAVAFAVWRR